jgi:hypothetical protein
MGNSDAVTEYKKLTKNLGKRSYLPFSKENNFTLSSCLSQHVLNMPKHNRDILRAINEDASNIYNYEYEYIECPLGHEFYHFVLRIDLLVICCGYIIDEETLKTSYPIIEFVQGYFE